MGAGLRHRIGYLGIDLSSQLLSVRTSRTLAEVLAHIPTIKIWTYRLLQQLGDVRVVVAFDFSNIAAEQPIGVEGRKVFLGCIDFVKEHQDLGDETGELIADTSDVTRVE